MIGSVLLKLPDVPRLEIGKRGFDDSELRDELGRWTADGPGEGEPPIVPQAEAEASIAAEAATEEVTTGALAPETVDLLTSLAGVLSGPIALAASILIPANESNIHYGEVPDFPGLHYRSDEGAVTISRLDAAGNIETLYQGMPDKEGFYHDKDGYVIGQHVGTGVMFDNEALADLVAEPSLGGDNGGIDPPLATEDGDEEACPAPTPENIKGRSKRSLAYQEQITGLPRGLDINYQGVRFDGCDNDTNRMMEAKGLGMDWMLNWPPDKLYNSKFFLRMMRQAGRQNAASAGRGDDYYFASEPMAKFFSAEFAYAGYSNITVHHIEAIVKKFAAFLYDCTAKHTVIH